MVNEREFINRFLGDAPHLRVIASRVREVSLTERESSWGASVTETLQRDSLLGSASSLASIY